MARAGDACGCCALADKPLYIDPAKLALKHDVDLVITLGDLQPSWIETLERLRLPKVGVYGNHDDEQYMDWFGIDDLHMRRLDLDGGLSFCRLRGLRVLPAHRAAASGRRTRRRRREADPQAARRRRAGLPLPAAGVNDDPDDPAHIGYTALRDWVDKHHPRWLLHGHVHPQPGADQRPRRRHPRGLRQRLKLLELE